MSRGCDVLENYRIPIDNGPWGVRAAVTRSLSGHRCALEFEGIEKRIEKNAEARRYNKRPEMTVICSQWYGRNRGYRIR
jgi:hypothetical protein